MTHDWLIGRRRVAAAVQGTPDCVPIYAALTEHARFLFGIPARTFYTVPEVFVEAQLLVSEYYGLDLPAVHGDVINIEAEALGRKVIYRPRSSPLLEPGPPLYATRTQIDAVPEIDPYRAGRMPFMLEVYRLVGERTGLPAERWFTAPFSLLCAVQGYERVVRDAAHDPAFLHHLLVTLRERVLPSWRSSRWQARRNPYQSRPRYRRQAQSPPESTSGRPWTRSTASGKPWATRGSTWNKASSRSGISSS